MTFLRPLRDKTETEPTANVLPKISSVEWLNGNGTDIVATF